MARKRKKHNQPTIRDIAREAEVSPTTVSLALEEKPTSRVSPATRQKITQIAKRLNYRPNYVARSLATNKSHIIGLVVPSLANPMYAEIAQDIIDRSNETGYGVLVRSVSGMSGSIGDEEVERRTVEDLLDRGADGLIICSSLRKSPLAYELVAEDVPVVLAMRTVQPRPDRPLVDFVGVDCQLGAYRAVDHLLRMGHTRIAMIGGPLETSTGWDRKNGAELALRAHGLELNPESVLVGDYRRASGHRLALELLQSGYRPTAIFAANDHMAIGVLEALSEQGCRVPEDLAVIGFDDTEMAGLAGISLTTVSQKKWAMGELALDTLLAKIERGSEEPPRQVLLDPVLVIRRSCGFLAAGRKYIKPEMSEAPDPAPEDDLEAAG